MICALQFSKYHAELKKPGKRGRVPHTSVSTKAPEETSQGRETLAARGWGERPLVGTGVLWVEVVAEGPGEVVASTSHKCHLFRKGQGGGGQRRETWGSAPAAQPSPADGLKTHGSDRGQVLGPSLLPDIPGSEASGDKNF